MQSMRSFFSSSNRALTRFEACEDFAALRVLLAKLAAKRDELQKAIPPDTLGSLAQNKYEILTRVINEMNSNIKKFNLAAGNYKPAHELQHMINLVALLKPIIFNAFSAKESSEILNSFRDSAHENIATAIDAAGYVATAAVTIAAPVSVLPKFLVFFGSRAVAETVNPKIKENIGVETEYTKSMQILQELYNTLAQLETNLMESYKRIAPQQSMQSSNQRRYNSSPK